MCTLQVGYITEDDVKLLAKPERSVVDQIIDQGPCPAGQLNHKDVLSLYLQGLVYFDIVIEDTDLMIMPPLEGFVMNRVTGDYFETLLYKIFVSMDEQTTVGDMASLLQVMKCGPPLIRRCRNIFFIENSAKHRSPAQIQNLSKFSSVNPDFQQSCF